ncbi:Octopamine receptor [Pseudolycoriella hygida]|uniref:Octopamine receptor n=1 Tax=Pseudolycoriella hygida TaxID=35572 RepID=A0A9Q0MY77_9DIPT|nr:Octopamine receptor [Pseudolycoriella hygida]
MGSSHRVPSSKYHRFQSASISSMTGCKDNENNRPPGHPAVLPCRLRRVIVMLTLRSIAKSNTLVILSVLTTRRLRTVTNCFVMSLAVADWLVGIFVMPPAVAVHLIGSWQLGWILCDIWISLDVLLCTASILSLCAISIDRYLAVTQPLNYSRRRRSKRLALVMILIVWVLALAITCPPILGWYEPGRRDLEECRYNQNEGYVIFSAMGSFFIPMAVMIYVYVRISCVVASRHDNMTEIEVHKLSLYSIRSLSGYLYQHTKLTENFYSLKFYTEIGVQTI